MTAHEDTQGAEFQIDDDVIQGKAWVVAFCVSGVMWIAVGAVLWAWVL